jgi:dihydrofolate synthase/folylpolyglutamate synthase
MQFSTLGEWLNWISSLHNAEIELGLERVKKVAQCLDILKPTCPVIIVGGTNGKGSTVAALSAIYRASGYFVGTFTSPVLFSHNEYVRIDDCCASDEAFCDAYTKIEKARGEISLTPFEFHTLAALLIFKDQPLDVMILEVGLGGRLDAVNILDADVAVVTSIGIDHTDWLGPTREGIGFEKAGIFRSHKFAVCGDANPPATLIDYAKKIDAKLFIQNEHFSYEGNKKTYLLPQNLSCAMMTVKLLQDKLPVAEDVMKTAIATCTLPGRLEKLDYEIEEIHDVSHNPEAIANLAHYLATHPVSGKTHAVFSMLKDKDIETSIKNIKSQINNWYLAPLATNRSVNPEQLRNIFETNAVKNVSLFTTIEQAYTMAKAAAEKNDRIVVFGSFHTVTAIKKIHLQRNQNECSGNNRKQKSEGTL